MADVLTEVPALGAHPAPEGTTFRAWTTKARDVAVVLYAPDGQERARHPMHEREEGLFEALVPGVGPGARYKFALDGEPFPDPYARFMPEGVHGPSEVWAPSYAFRHARVALPPERRVFYELHIGTFTPEGTYAAARARLSELHALGVNAIELMPLSAFPGERGWGYDGVAAFAPHAPYGRPEELMALIDEAHGLGMAVWLDAVYNHFGPDGNYLWVYSNAYFTDKVKTPWGDALDYENPYMRQLVLDAAMQWLTVYRFDGLRLDATHAIVDNSPRHILAELAERAHALEPPAALIAEDDRNEPGLVTDFCLDGIWSDDFHHMVHVLLTGEQDGYYQGYAPELADLVRTISLGWLYEGQIWPLSGKPRGKQAGDLEGPRFVYCIQNHDQVGNRALGERLSRLISTDAYLAASALLLFLPATPLLFMGQEWGASSPFCFFSDHHGELGRAVSAGRIEEFSHFEAFKDPQARARIPDPQARSTFEASKLDWSEREKGDHARVHEAYKALLRLRRTDPALANGSRITLSAGMSGEVLWVMRWCEGNAAVLLVNFGPEVAMDQVSVPGFVGTSTLWESVAIKDRMPRHAALILGGPAA